MPSIQYLLVFTDFLYMCFWSSGIQHVYWRCLCLHHHHANVSPAGLLQGWCRVYYLPVSEMVSQTCTSDVQMKVWMIVRFRWKRCFCLSQAVSCGQDQGKRVRRVLRRTKTKTTQRINGPRHLIDLLETSTRTLGDSGEDMDTCIDSTMDAGSFGVGLLSLTCAWCSRVLFSSCFLS